MKEFTLLLLVVVTVVMLMMHARSHNHNHLKHCGCSCHKKEGYKSVQDSVRNALFYTKKCKQCYGLKWRWSGKRQLCRSRDMAGRVKHKPLCN